MLQENIKINTLIINKNVYTVFWGCSTNMHQRTKLPQTLDKDVTDVRQRRHGRSTKTTWKLEKDITDTRQRYREHPAEMSRTLDTHIARTPDD